MKIELEHGDICKALSAYLREKNFLVDADPRNFAFKEETPGELSVLVRNGDMVPVSGAEPRAASSVKLQMQRALAQVTPQRAPAPAPVQRPPQQHREPRGRTPPRNDLFEPVPPPPTHIPQPHHRILDPQAARSPALLSAPAHPAMPVARKIVASYAPENSGEELVEAAAPPSLAESDFVTDPDTMNPEERRVYEGVLSEVRGSEGVSPQQDDLDLMGAGEPIE